MTIHYTDGFDYYVGGPLTFHGYSVSNDFRKGIANLCYFLMTGKLANYSTRMTLMGRGASLSTHFQEMMEDARLFGCFPDWHTLHSWKGIESDPDHPLSVKLKLAVPNFHEIIQFYEFEKRCMENQRLHDAIQSHQQLKQNTIHRYHQPLKFR